MKDAYYFPHDSNAKDDPKIIVLMEELGPEGYGIFWILIETLRDQPDYKADIRILPGLARRYNTTFDKMKSVVWNFGLFEIDDQKFFYSPSFHRRMSELDRKRELKRKAGKKSGEARRSQVDVRQQDRTPVQHQLNTRSTDVEQGKERKGKKREKRGSETAPSLSKSDKPINKQIPPKLDWVKNYAKERNKIFNPELESEKFFDHHEARGWCPGGKQKMKDWQAAWRTWERRSMEFNTNTQNTNHGGGKVERI